MRHDPHFQIELSGMGRLGASLLSQICAVGVAVILAGCGTAKNRDALLRELKSGLAAVRALPSGSRPDPPELDLRGLARMSKSELLQSLGNPTYCGDDGDDECATSSSWKYDWGPPAPAIESGDGFVEITTGGPFVIALEFTHESVSSARWQGQK